MILLLNTSHQILLDKDPSNLTSNPHKNKDPKREFHEKNKHGLCMDWHTHHHTNYVKIQHGEEKEEEFLQITVIRCRFKKKYPKKVLALSRSHTL